jgi:hypothetical protein
VSDDGRNTFASTDAHETATFELVGEPDTTGPFTMIGWALFLAVVACWPVAVFATWALLLRATS